MEFRSFSMKLQCVNKSNHSGEQMQKMQRIRRALFRGLWCSLFILALVAGTASKAIALGTVAGTNITNQAYADYQDANGNPLPRALSNTVTTTVSQVAGVDVNPATAALSGQVEHQVAFASTVTNTGNGPDTFILSALAPDPSWLPKIYFDTNGNGIWDPNTDTTQVTNTGSLPPNGTYRIFVVVTVPAGTPIATYDTTLTATSQFNGTIFDTGVYTTSVQNAVLNVNKSVVDPLTPIKPGDVVTYRICGQNTGTIPAYNVTIKDLIPSNTTYVLESIRIGPQGGTYATATHQTDALDADRANFNVSTPGAITVFWGTAPPMPDPNGSGCIYFQVTVNSAVPSGTSVSDQAAVTYTNIDGHQQPPLTSNSAVFPVASVASISVAPSQQATHNPGDQMVYPLNVCNNGNVSDTVNLTYTSSLGLTWIFWMDVDNNGIPNTDGDYIITNTGPIPPFVNNCVHVLAVATLPPGTADASIDITVITGTSTVNPLIKATATLTTTVTAPQITLVKKVAPLGNQPPGTTLTYTITATNVGTGRATNVLINDLIPNNTTYTPGTIMTGPTELTLVSRTDADDGDGGEYDSTAHTVIAGKGAGSINLVPGGTWVLLFKVTIN